MGRRGTKPMPTALLEAAGSWRAKTREGEPEPEPLEHAAPGNLAGEALRVWNDLRPRLTWLGATDRNTLARYCIASAKFAEVQALDPINGTDAEFSRFTKLCEVLLRMEVQLGMTPSARTSIRVEPKKKTHGNSLRLFPKKES